MSKTLRYQFYTLHIDPTFWSTLYGKKLDTWKLDDSEKLCYASISSNSIFFDRTSLNDDDATNHSRIEGIIKVFNTRNDLLLYHSSNKQQILRRKVGFVLLVHADLKQYSFDYFFALPTRYYKFNAKLETGKIDKECSSFDCQIIRERECYAVPFIIGNRIFEDYAKGVRFFEFKNNANGTSLFHLKTSSSEIRYTGWNSATLTTTDLSKKMDPNIIAEQNAERNLKLMMWKHEPNLPLDKLRKVNCLLIGAGTVGCSVARNLIAWGLKNITFVDCATVSHANPVRQNLYTTKDIGKEKSQIATETLFTILPSVNAKGYTLDIPMPGHADISNETDYNILNELVQKSDVIFLSTDSREGRWLPIILAQIHGKDMINIALGYDSMLVQYINNENGCYFCTDPVGPRDTMSTRTIDEKCTITRPGISNIASAIAVEFYVDIIRGAANHHMTRFNFTDMQFIQHKTYKHPMCCCCSLEIVSELSDKGYKFIKEVESQPSTIVDLSGYVEDEFLDGDLESLPDIDIDTESIET